MTPEDDEDGTGSQDETDASWLVGGSAPTGDSAPLARLHFSPSPALRELDALLELGREGVQALSSITLHRVINDVGLHEALDLLELAEPEQIREIFDLQIWRHDRIDHEELLDWTHALTLLSDEARPAALLGLDVELLGFLLRNKCRIYLAQDEEEPPPEEPEGTFYKTPDNWFILDILEATETEAEQLMALVEALYIDDAEAARRLLQTVSWELTSELEEYSLRWRLARLQDLGFVDPLEALIVYAPLDPATVRADEGTADRPLRADPEPLGKPDARALAPAGDDGTFWARALALIEDEAERERLAQSMMFLANRTLVADRISTADQVQAKESLEELRGRLSIGLEHLCEGQLERAATVLKQVSLLRISRLGYSLILAVGKPLLPLLRERRLGRQPRKLDLLEAPLAERLQRLISQRPRLVGGKKVRPFRALADLEAPRLWVQQALLAALLSPPERWPAPATDLPAELDLPTLFRSRVISTLLERPAPFDAAALAALRSHLAGTSFDAAVADAARAEILETLGEEHDRLADASQLVARWFGELADTLAAIDPAEAIDPRYIVGLWLQQAEV